ncbi:cytochrome P450 [Halioxenophilus sp. WMMB6]|uniref:cytochrome P450 n=1 Tax=Halioxenophilus sp. WMMB6 TaxID=3073815 RepID=UPI00295E4B4E|nr:cytochrome P450 [Halioxenophilus sp. WMMB6]
MNTTLSDPLYYDPYLPSIVKSPYPVYQRLREEAPVYYNEQYDFYALSRYEDVRRGLLDNKVFSSARGGILEIIKANAKLPPGTFIFDDPPRHTIYRTIVQRMFTPRRMLGMEEKVRAITVDCLNNLAGRDEFDFIADLGTQVPMRVIGTLLGIPEEDFQSVREQVDAKLATVAGQQMDVGDALVMNESFEAYIDWRKQNPADDVITELLGVEFTDDLGEKRKLTREELLSFVNMLAGAGNETTNKLIGWTGKILAEHPDQRRALVENPGLIPDALEEILRYEPPGPHIARYVTEDVEYQGQIIPAGSTVLLIAASANRDASVFPDPDRFDIYRDRAAHCTFGYGIHTCIGNVLARTEGRVVMEELLKRYPEWDIDLSNAHLFSTSTVRGWETLPAYMNARGAEQIRARVNANAQAEAAAAASAPASVDGEWSVVVKGPTGPMESMLSLRSEGGQLMGEQTGDGTTTALDSIDYTAANGEILWTSKISKPMKLKLQFKGSVTGDSMSGKVKAGFMGSFAFTAKKVPA